VIDTPMAGRVFAQRPELRQVFTEGEPVGRLGRPDEIAAAVVWRVPAATSSSRSAVAFNES
jgi:NAD(P)-dependent dehydrogenase (short-subunit alcohol dehydrogenase family)